MDQPPTLAQKRTASIDEWLDSRYQTQAHDKPWLIDRFSACRALKDGGMSCYVWSEDASSYYGVPTAVFDIHIVVDDVAQATALLLEKGWLRPPPEFYRRFDPVQSTCYLVEPKDVEACRSDPHWVSAVSLLVASDWNVRLPDISHSDLGERWPFMPPLPELVDGIVQKWLDTTEQQDWFRLHIGCFLGYLYHHIPILKVPEFGLRMRKENRQYHYDQVSGMSMPGNPYWRKARQDRDAIRGGTAEPRRAYWYERVSS